MSRDVVAVEPFYDNIVRIHKAAKLEGIDDKITLVKNAVSNESNIVMKLIQNDRNIGGQSLDMNNKGNIQKNDLDKYIVETILIDDLLEILPKKSDGTIYKKGIMKMDIEGFEIYAIQSAKILFDILDIRFVYMEMLNLVKRPEIAILVENLVNFFISKNYRPFTISNSELDIRIWNNWPGDIVWIKS